MALLRALLCSLLLFLATKVSGESVVAILGESVSFTLTQSCASRVELVTRDNSRTVAQRTDGEWSPGEDYMDRIRHISASQVELLHVNYNDEGTFEFLCGTKAPSIIQLRTVRIQQLEVEEGAPLRLPCDSYTAGGAEERPVSWEKDGKVVLELDPDSGLIMKETSRLQVSDAAWRAGGDATARLERVEKEDEGDYICSGYDQEGKRRYAALRVTVKERQLSTPPPPSSPPPKQAETGIWHIVAIIFIITTTVILLVIVGVCVYWLKKRRDGAAGGGRAPPETRRLTASDPASNGDCVSCNGCAESAV